MVVDKTDNWFVYKDNTGLTAFYYNAVTKEYRWDPDYHPENSPSRRTASPVSECFNRTTESLSAFPMKIKKEPPDLSSDSTGNCDHFLPILNQKTNTEREGRSNGTTEEPSAFQVKIKKEPPDTNSGSLTYGNYDQYLPKLNQTEREGRLTHMLQDTTLIGDNMPDTLLKKSYSDDPPGDTSLGHNSRSYECSICKATFPGYNAAQCHYKTHDVTLPSQVDKLMEELTRDKCIGRKRRIKFNCNKCNISVVSSKGLLRIHFLEEHSGSEAQSYTCCDCKEGFTELQAMESHSCKEPLAQEFHCESPQAAPSIFKCTICLTLCQSFDALQSHFITHFVSSKAGTTREAKNKAPLVNDHRQELRQRKEPDPRVQAQLQQQQKQQPNVKEEQQQQRQELELAGQQQTMHEQRCQALQQHNQETEQRGRQGRQEQHDKDNKEQHKQSLQRQPKLQPKQQEREQTRQQQQIQQHLLDRNLVKKAEQRREEQRLLEHLQKHQQLWQQLETQGQQKNRTRLRQEEQLWRQQETHGRNQQQQKKRPQGQQAQQDQQNSEGVWQSQPNGQVMQEQQVNLLPQQLQQEKQLQHRQQQQQENEQTEPPQKRPRLDPQDQERQMHTQSVIGKEKFHCKYCFQGFESLPDLVLHEKPHKNSERPYKCKDCDKCYKSADNRRAHHERIHLKLYENIVASYKCQDCDKVFKDSSAQKSHHRRVHQKLRPYTCPTCGMRFSERSNMKRHEMRHMPREERRFNCKGCGAAIMPIPDRLCNKCDTQVGEPLKCKYCDMGFTRRSLLERHVKKHEVELKCEFCSKVYHDKNSFGNHMNSHKDGKFSCNVCGRKVLSAVGFTIHMRTHTGEKPYDCTECDKKFASMALLKLHREVHTGLRPYKCETCGKSFARNWTLKIHRKMHAKKPFECKKCGKVLNNKQHLANHTAMHKGRKPFLCKKCKKAFTKTFGLKMHSKTHEG